MGRQLTVTLPDPDDTGPLDAPVSTSTYGPDGRLASVEDFEGQTVIYTYTASGQVATVTDPRGVTTYTHDALGRTINITEPDPDGGGPLPAPFTTSVFDDEGQLIEVTTLDGTTTYEFDQLGRTTKVTQRDPGSGDAPWTTFTYDLAGNRLTESNRLGHTTEYEFDNVGQLIKLIDAELGETTYSNDELGNRLSLTDPVGNTTSWAYDGFSRMTQETNELDDERHYVYDLAGNILEYTDRNGRVTEYAYDNLQRRIGETWLDGITPIHTLQYGYDAASQLTFAGDSQAEYTFAYDNLGRVISTEHDLDALGFSVTLDQAYDALGRRISLAAEIDETADLINHYEYDFLNRMTQVTQSGQSGGNAVAEKRVDFAYDPLHDSRYESVTRYADLAGTKMVAATDYSYDANSRLVALTHADSLSAILAGYTWSHDHAGRLTDFTVAGYLSENATYTYDDTDQLIGADRDGTAHDESYAYDSNGNRTGSGNSTGDDNQLLSDGTYNYQYDAEGNRIKKITIATGATTDYTWDHHNNLVEVVEKNASAVTVKTVQYGYDAFDHKISKNVITGSGTQTEVYVYDGLRQEQSGAGDTMILRFDGSGDVTNRYLHGPAVDQILADEQVASTTTPGDVFWPLTDHLGSVRDVAEYDAVTGITSIANHIVYDSFGNRISETNAAVDTLFGYTGREWDDDVDLQYNRARWYDPATGRWLSNDPIGFNAGDANLYRYVGNRVLTHTDPTGEEGRWTFGTFFDWLRGTGSYAFPGTEFTSAAECAPGIAVIAIGIGPEKEYRQALMSGDSARIDRAYKKLLETRRKLNNSYDGNR